MSVMQAVGWRKSFPKGFPAPADMGPDVAMRHDLPKKSAMKILLASTLFLIAPVSAQAACSASDFAIQNFKPQLGGGSMARSVSLSGDLINHCADPSAAQIEIVAKNGSGDVIARKKAWPAGTSNISPGKSVSFELGRLFRYTTNMKTFSATVINVRSW